MQNGNLTIFRVIASGIIGLVGILGGIYLLYSGVAVPREYWLIIAAAIGGVVGADVLASLLKALRK